MKSTALSTLWLLAGVSSSIAACNAPAVNSATTEVIKKLEGYVAELYDDGYGTQHVGYGHACEEKDCAEVQYPIPISKTDAEKLLQTDLKSRESCVVANVNNDITLNANQYGALVSFVFNVGCGNFADSTLRKRLNRGEDPATVAKEELPKWNKAGGVVAPGLVERRKQEIALFNTATSEPALPACDEPTSSAPAPTSTKEPEPTDTEPTDPKPTDPEPTDTEPTDPEPTEAEPTEQTPSDTAAPTQDTSLSTALSNSEAPVPTGGPGSSDVVVPTASRVSQPSGPACTPVAPVPTKTSGGGSTGTNVPVKPTCTDGSCMPVTGGSATLYVNVLAAVVAILAAVF